MIDQLTIAIAIALLVIIQVLLLIAIYKIRRRIEIMEIPGDWEKQLNTLKEKLRDQISSLEENVESTNRLIEERLHALESYSRNNTDLFETVLHGFDFIVQGCKTAVTANRQLLSSSTAQLEPDNREAIDKQIETSDWRSHTDSDIETDEWAAKPFSAEQTEKTVDEEGAEKRTFEDEDKTAG